MDTLDHGLSGTGRGSSNPMAFARSTLSCWHVLTYLILRHTSSLVNSSPSRPLCGAFPGDQPPVVVIVSWHSFWISQISIRHEKSIPFPFVTKSPSLIQTEYRSATVLQPGYVGQVNWSGTAMLTGLPFLPAFWTSSLFHSTRLGGFLGFL